MRLPYLEHYSIYLTGFLVKNEVDSRQLGGFCGISDWGDFIIFSEKRSIFFSKKHLLLNGIDDFACISFEVYYLDKERTDLTQYYFTSDFLIRSGDRI